MKLKISLIVLLFLLPLFSYLLWPLSSDGFKIDIDKNKTAFKQKFLNNKVKNDSLPNIVLVMFDDLGMADLSLYGDGYPNTPNIDNLGSEGMVFNNAYVTSPVCSPSRAAILTGRYQQRFGFQFQMHERYLKNRLEYLGFKYFVDSAPWDPKWMEEVPDELAMSSQGLPPSEIILPELLKTKGYKTALIGKWHLGADSLRIPCNFGFDYQYGFYASHSLYAYENTAEIHDQKNSDDFTDPHIWSGQRNGAHAIYKNSEEIEVKEYLTDRFTDEAISYLGEQKSDPFFLYLSYNAPHTPLQAPTEYMELYSYVSDPVKRTYYAMIKNLDDNIGRLLRVVDDLKLTENTLIFLISDNGGAEYTYTTENGEYKGGKITNFEGGVKVPFIMKWKGKIEPGVYDPMVSSMDIFQTSVEMAGVELPTDRTYDGTNLIHYLTSNTSNFPHEQLFWQRGISKAVRTNEWKFIYNELTSDSVLFDMTIDKFEKNDVYIDNKPISSQLARTHSKWSADLPPPLWPSLIYFEFWDGNKRYFFDQ